MNADLSLYLSVHAAIGIAAGVGIGKTIVFVLDEYVSRDYICHGCENESRKMTHREYKAHGGFHPECQVSDMESRDAL